MDLVTTNTVPQTTVNQTIAGPGDIAFSIGECALGKVLVARSTAGICAILMGSDGEELKRNLADRFPGRRLVSDGSQLATDLSSVTRFIETPGDTLDLPLDLQHGTPFQRRVWEVLRAVPCGATITYAALARRIGSPNATRAVASACAANAIALGIPCHRVIRSDGTLSGYRWGLERKRALIDKELVA